MTAWAETIEVEEALRRRIGQLEQIVQAQGRMVIDALTRIQRLEEARHGREEDYAKPIVGAGVVVR